MPNKSFEELKATGALPSPPGVGMEILRIIQNDNCEVGELARVIQSDPALTGRLLQIANSALTGMARPVTTIQEATMRLGLRSVRGVALGFSLVSAHRAGACEGFDYAVFWSQSLARAVAAHALATRLRVGQPAEAFVAALLSDLGSLALATVHPRDYTEILRSRGSETAAGRALLEQRRFGIDHREVTAAMLREWMLPEAFAAAAAAIGTIEPPVADGRRGPTLTHVLWIATRFATAFVLAEDKPLDAENVQKALSRFPEWNHEELADTWSQLAESWRRWGNLLDIVTTAVPPFGTGASAQAPRDPIAVRVAGRATEPAPAPPPVAPAEVEEHARARVLAVDDDAASLRALATQLEKAGHEVMRAANGREALKIAMRVIPQIVIADWQMPEMDGVALCRALRAFEAGRCIYTILLAGDQDEDQLVEAFDAGFDDYVVKPCTPKLLLARIRAGMRVVKMQERIDADWATMQKQVADLGVLNRRLKEVADTDVLTGLENRRFAMDLLKESWERSLREDEPLSLIMVDVDRFKRVNDTCGHDAGDLVLKEAAGVLRTHTDPPAGVCRIGGDEFLLILPATTGDKARTHAEKLRKAFETRAMKFGGLEGRVAASFGVSTRLANVASFEQLLKLADESLYRAKEAGRNKVSFAQADGKPVSPSTTPSAVRGGPA